METAEIMNFEDPEAYKLRSDGSSETHKSTDDDRMMHAVLIGEQSRLTNLFKSTALKDQINASDSTFLSRKQSRVDDSRLLSTNEAGVINLSASQRDLPNRVQIFT